MFIAGNQLTPKLLLSVRPVFAESILSGSKTVELRRRFSNQVHTDAHLLIYASSPKKAIVGYTKLERVYKAPIDSIWREHSDSIGISMDGFYEYFNGLDLGYALVLKEPITLHTERSLEALRNACRFTPPQSYCFVTDEFMDWLCNGTDTLPFRYKHHSRH
jgi:predicted transcriptional regulator